MVAKTLNDLDPTERQGIFNLVCEELLLPQFEPEKYAPREGINPDKEEELGQASEGLKKLFAYACRICAWCVSPPEDTPQDVLPVLQLKLEAAQYLLIEEVMERFGERLRGRPFDLRQYWTVVATDDLRDGHGEIFRAGLRQESAV